MREGDRLQPYIERELTDLFEREIHYQNEFERQLVELRSRFDWSIEGAFRVLDLDSLGFITADNICRYLRVHGYSAEKAEINAIIRRLDIDCDFNLSFYEFQ